VVQESEQPAARPDGERLCGLAAATLQQSLGSQTWQWHDEHAGETASVPLCWLTQIEEGIRLLQGAAKREPALLRVLAEHRVRADGAEELSARRLAQLEELETELCAHEEREATLRARCEVNP